MAFLVIGCHWHWHHVMPTVSSMTPLDFLGQDDQNEVKHDFLVM